MFGQRNFSNDADVVGTLADGTPIRACTVHPNALNITDPITGEVLARDKATRLVVKVKMDSSIPKRLVNRLPFDDPEADWIEEASDEEDVPEGWLQPDEGYTMEVEAT